jgi:hypothetical protein
MTLHISKHDPNLCSIAGQDIEAELKSGLFQYACKVMRHGRVIYRRVCKSRIEAEADAVVILSLIEA